MSRHDVGYAREEAGQGRLFLATAPRTLQVRELGEQVAATNAPVLITGESGVGKDVLARFIHSRSERANRAFVKINCAAVPHELLESELFGHERGAFTGAHQRKEGKFEAAQGGTILLDEIGDMSLPLQAKLLHVLEDASYSRVGGNQAVRMDARVLATTNKPLERAIADGEFRRDLYFRLKVIQIHIPPLRERREDIPLLCDHVLLAHAGRYDAGVSRIPGRLMEAFMAYEWPGNVRELKHLIQRYLILPDEEMVLEELASASPLDELEARPPARRSEAPAAPMPGGGFGAGLGAHGLDGLAAFGSAPQNGHTNGNGHTDHNGNGHPDAIGFVVSRGGRAGRPTKIPLKMIAAKAAEDAEKRVILQVLLECRWNRKRAASRMDICYKTLLNKLDRWELDGDIPASSPGLEAQQPSL
jgi:two-component system response regulator AtoC